MSETKAVPHVPGIEPGRFIRIGRDRWEIRSVLLGALTQEDAVEVRRIGFSAPNDADGFPTFTHVPDLFVRALLACGVAVLEPSPTEEP